MVAQPPARPDRASAGAAICVAWRAGPPARPWSAWATVGAYFSAAPNLIAGSRMNHAGGAAIAEHRLVGDKARHVHGEKAEFLVLDSCHRRPIIGQAAVQAIPEQVKGDSRVRQRRLLDKMATVAEIHGVEKRGRSVGALFGREMVGAIHEHQAPERTGGRVKVPTTP